MTRQVFVYHFAMFRFSCRTLGAECRYLPLKNGLENNNVLCWKECTIDFLVKSSTTQI